MKNNLFKRIAAVAFAAATILTCAPTSAMAETPTKGSVTITKYTGGTKEQGYEDVLSNDGSVKEPITGDRKLLNGVKFACLNVGTRHQIAVDNNGIQQTEMVYKLTDSKLVTILELKDNDVVHAIGDADTKYYRGNNLNEKLKNPKIKTTIIEHVKEAESKTTKTTSGQGATTFDKLDLETLYLFAEIDATAATDTDGTAVKVTKLSVPFFVSLPFTNPEGEQMYNIYAYPKNATGTVEINKGIVEGDKTVTVTNANIGDVIKYKVTYSVPVGENGLRVLNVVDKMDKGLTFNAENGIQSIKHLKAGIDGADTELVKDTDYTVSSAVGADDDKGKTIITINFKKYLNDESMKPSSTQEFEITYEATLNENAVLGQNGNKNDVTLNYQNTNEADVAPVPGNSTKVFTYGIDLLKKGEGENVVLKDVEFKLTKGNSADQATDVNVIEVTDSANPSNSFYAPGNSATTNVITTDDNGKINIRGLEPGTYFLTETKTNAGYVLLKDPVKIVITQSDATNGTASATVNDKDVTMTNDEINTDSATAKVPVTVINHKGFDLPATGGAGTALFTIAGIVIVVVAGALLLMRRKTNK